MKKGSERKDILMIARCIAGAVLVGLAVVTVYLFSKDGNLSGFLWALAFLMCGTAIGFLFGIPRILANDAVAEEKPGATASTSTTRRTVYRPSSHLERISDWLTTLIVGLTLVQWDYVNESFYALSDYIAKGLAQAAKAPDAAAAAGSNPDHSSFASAMILYFSINGFLGSYLLTRIYLSRIFQETDVGISDLDLRTLHQADFSNPMNGNARSDLRASAKNVLELTLEQLSSIEQVIAWSKAQFIAGNYANAIEGYKRALEIVPSDIQLLLEYSNALYHAGAGAADTVKAQYREESRALLNRAHSLLGQSTSPELKMKVYRALTYFNLFSDLESKDFENTITVGEQYVADTDPKKILSVGILVNVACAYAQRFSLLEKHQGTNAEKALARDKALEYVQRALSVDNADGRWKRRLQYLLEKDDLKVFQADPAFRKELGLP